MSAEKTKTKQIVVNVSEESKTAITALKEQLKVSDKEFIAVALAILANTKPEVIQAAVEDVTFEKQRAKMESKLARITAQLEKVKAEAAQVGVQPQVEVEGEVVYQAEEEEAIA
jgi:nucleotide-binding universal stress UspA family protein